MFRKPGIFLLAVALAAVSAAPSQARVYSLDECVELALTSNVSLAKATESLTGANADVLLGWSGALPRISGSITRSRDMMMIDGGEFSSGGASGRVSLSQTIFDGSTFADISAARHGREAVRHSLEATRRAVIFSTKEGYYGLLKAEALRDVQAEALELAQEQLRKTDSLFELGSASRSDLLKAQVQVGQAELALISADRSAETARAGLCYTLGIDVATAVEVVDPPAEEREVEIDSYDVDEAISRRPDVQAAELSVVAARRSLLAAKAGRWPDLGFSLSYSRSEDSLGELGEDLGDNHTRSMDLTLSVPIFNGLGTKASSARACGSRRRPSRRPRRISGSRRRGSGFGPRACSS